jgi:hypothetical protein
MPRPTVLPEYVSHWTTIAGALAGTLRALGGTLAAADVNARAGHAFRFAIVPALTDDGAIGADGPNRFASAPALRLYESLGWRFSAVEGAFDDPRLPSVRAAALDRLRKTTPARPAIAYGLHLPEFGIVRALDGDAIAASTPVSAQFGERISTRQWPAPGLPLPVRVFIPEERTRETLALGPLLRFVVAYAREGDSPVAIGVDGAITGFAAFERWIALLEGDERISPSGHAYCLQALQQGRKEAAAFLRAAGAGTAIDRPLRAAATAYEAEVLALALMVTLFPYPNGGDLGSPGARRVAALYVRRAYDAEREAVARLADAVGL